jgi:hypothetical protein
MSILTQQLIQYSKYGCPANGGQERLHRIQGPNNPQHGHQSSNPGSDVMHPLDLEAVEPTFCRRIVAAIPFAAH